MKWNNSFFLNLRNNLVKERLYYFIKEFVLKYNIWFLEFSRIGNVFIVKYVYICIVIYFFFSNGE